MASFEAGGRTITESNILLASIYGAFSPFSSPTDEKVVIPMGPCIPSETESEHNKVIRTGVMPGTFSLKTTSVTPLYVVSDAAKLLPSSVLSSNETPIRATVTELGSQAEISLASILITPPEGTPFSKTTIKDNSVFSFSLGKFQRD